MAKQMMDIGLDEHADLKVVAGDFVVVESKVEHNKNLILSTKGEYEERPLMGAGAINYVDDENPYDLIQEIADQLRKDGMDIKSVRLAGGVIKTDGYYK